MIIKNNLDVGLFIDGEDVIIDPLCEYQCNEPKTGKMKLRCKYGVVTILFGVDNESGIDTTCSDVHLAVIYRFDMGSTNVTCIEIYKRIIFDCSSDKNQSFDSHIFYNKPPLGCATFDMIAGDRIHELSSAIDRYSSESKDNIDLIRKWAKEIILQCDLIDKMKDMKWYYDEI